MYKFHNNILPSIFESFFTRVDQVHNYRTRSSTSESYYIPKVRTMIMDYLILDIKVQLLTTTIVHFDDKSMKLCHITNIPSTNIFGYGASPNSLMLTSNAHVIKY